MSIGAATGGLALAALAVAQFIPGVGEAADAAAIGYRVYTATDGAVTLLSASAATPGMQAALDLNTAIEALDVGGAVSAGAASFAGGAGLGMTGGAFAGLALTASTCSGT